MVTRRVSVEISSSAVRMAEVVTGHGRPELIRLGQVALPPQAVIDGVILEQGVVRVALERCMKEGGFTAGDVHLGIAGLRAITRELEMPLLPDAEIDSAVRLQALDVIPFAIDKALISARPLEETVGPNGMPERRVLVAAAHRDLVDPLVEVATAAGLVPVSIEPTSSAIIRALFSTETAIDGPEAIVSVGADLTTVAVHENGVPHFVRTIAEGGDTITAAIAGVLDLPLADAESLKQNLDGAAPHIHTAIGAARDAAMSLIGELRSSIDYYATLTGRSPVRRVVITGGGSRLYGFAEQLQQQLRLPVFIGSVLNQIDCSRLHLPTEEIRRLDASVAVVVGLAIQGSKDVKELDLLPPEVILGRKRKQLERTLMLVAVFIVLVMVALGALRFLKVHDAENQVASLQNQITAVRIQIPKYNKVQQERSEIVDLSAVSNPIVNDEVYWPGVIAALRHSTPSGGTISTFSAAIVPRTIPATTAGAPAAVVLPPSETQIATLNLSLASSAGYPYFRSWYYSVDGSGKLTVNGFSGITEVTSPSVTFSATVGVTGEVTSIRANEFKVP
ncbi:MAG: pilus assembly protein PilM [Acidimicrobiales bacterium]